MKGMGWLAGGRLIGHACSLARNILLARLIGPENLGVAATFVLTLSFLEAISTLAVDRLLVQAQDGDAERFQKTAQATQFVRGAVIGAALFGLSWSLASLFGAPQALPMYQAIAIVPLLRGLFHMDTKRVQRDMRFDLDVKLEVVAQAAMLALVWPLCAWLGDYRAAAAVVIAGTAVHLLASHLLAERPYGWAWDRAYARRILTFGWPLLVNGLLMFLILQGDTFVLGSAEKLLGVAYTHEDVGQFAAAAGLAMAVHAAISSVCSSVFLPLLSRVQNDVGRFNDRSALCVQSVALIAVVLGAGGILASAALFDVLYGPAYAVAGTVFAWLIAMQMVRMMRVAPTLAAMAKGDTAATMAANAVRVVGFAAVIAVAARHGSLALIAAVGLASEVTATIFAYAWVASRHGLSGRGSIAPVSVGLGIITGCLLMVAQWNSSAIGPYATILIAGCIALLCGGVALLVLPVVRRELRLASQHWCKAIRADRLVREV